MLSTGLTGSLLASLIGVPAYAALPAEVVRPDVAGGDRTATITGTVKVRPRPADPVGTAAVTDAGNAQWPAAGRASIAATGGAATVGGMKVRLGSAAKTASATQVQVLDQAAAAAAGVDGVLLRVSGTPAQQQQLTVDYSSFLGAFGGGYGSRLTLSRIPDCALITPNEPQCAPIPLATTNDTEQHTLSAKISLPTAAGNTATGASTAASPGVTRTASYAATDAAATKTAVATGSASTTLAVTASDSSAQGDYSATPVKASSKWSTSLSSGQFSWSYPMRVPPVPGGLVPNVEISYSSQAMDGQTAATNNQGSWIGAGFSYEPGYVERRYKPCSDDGHEGKSDLCWGTLYRAKTALAAVNWGFEDRFRLPCGTR